MPRRKPTEEEFNDPYPNDPYRSGLAHWAWLTEHPEERRKEWSAHMDRHDRLTEAHLKKFQPVVTDMNFNGEFVHVEFTRNNGERVRAGYRLCIWDRPPANLWNQKEEKALERVRALDAAEAQPPPEPGKTPQS
jgi:hypothetical protein